MAKKKAVPDAGMVEFWNDRARLLAVMAHPVRLAILETLCERPSCVKDVNALVPLAQAHLSQHLAALRKANVIASHTCGTLRCYYVLQPSLVKKLIALLRQEHSIQEHDCQTIIRQSRSKQQCGRNRAKS